MHLPDIKTAIEMYDRCTEIGNKEISMLFGTAKDKTLKLKKAVKEEMAKTHKLTFMPGNVDTVTAYRVWGIDIEDYRKRYARLKKNEMLYMPREESQTCPT